MGAEEPADLPEPMREPPEAGPTGLEDAEVALAPASGEGGEAIPGEENLPPVSAQYPNEEDREDDPTESPAPTDEISTGVESPEATSTENLAEVQRVEILAVQENATAADATPDEAQAAPDADETTTGEGRPPEVERGSEPDAYAETPRDDTQMMPDEVEEPLTDERTEAREVVTPSSVNPQPETPGEGEPGERRSPRDRLDRDREADPASPEARPERNLSGETARERVSDYTDTFRADAADEPEPRQVSGEADVTEPRQAVEGVAVRQQTVTIRQTSPGREVLRVRERAGQEETSNETPPERRTTGQRRQGGER